MLLLIRRILRLFCTYSYPFRALLNITIVHEELPFGRHRIGMIQLHFYFVKKLEKLFHEHNVFNCLISWLELNEEVECMLLLRYILLLPLARIAIEKTIRVQLSREGKRIS